MNQPDPVSVEHFESMYRAQVDPWQFRTSTYERSRYDALLAALSKTSYRCALEPGCSIGEFTAQLAPRCERLVSFDFAASAVAVARARCKDLPQVALFEADLGSYQPDERFDLIIVSEVGYYFKPDALRSVVSHLAASLEPGGELFAAHWLGHSEDHVLHGDEVHDILLDAMPLTHQYARRHDAFRIDSWTR
jgi:SAM-dependent methyltransferase